MNLFIYLSCCVYFAVVSKEKFFLKSSSLALVELRGSGIVFLTCLCVPECWIPPANQTRTSIREQALRTGDRCTVNPGRTGPGQGWMDAEPPTGQFLYTVKDKLRTNKRIPNGWKVKSKGILKVSILVPVVGASVQLALETYLCSLGVSPPCGGRESNRHTGPRGLVPGSWFRDLECFSKP